MKAHFRPCGSVKAYCNFNRWHPFYFEYTFPNEYNFTFSIAFHFLFFYLSLLFWEMCFLRTSHRFQADSTHNQSSSDCGDRNTSMEIGVEDARLL